MHHTGRRLLPRILALGLLAALAACGSVPKGGGGNSERACMARAMYFESNRSSEDGMLAVGTVVMNRLHSGKYPKTVCGVVGQKNQFAPGVLTKPMKEGASRARAERMADAVLRGKRHRGVGKAMFFHTAGYNFRYNNMHYQVIAGGNAFYEKRTPKAGQRNRTQMEVAQAMPRARPARDPEVQVAMAPVPRPAAAPRYEAPPPVVAFAPEPDGASIEALILAEAQ